jgi:hypothetical protein
VLPRSNVPEPLLEAVASFDPVLLYAVNVTLEFESGDPEKAYESV